MIPTKNIHATKKVLKLRSLYYLSSNLVLIIESWVGIAYRAYPSPGLVRNSEFSFALTGRHTRVKETSLPYYLPICEEIIIGFIPFLGSISAM